MAQVALSNDRDAATDDGRFRRFFSRCVARGSRPPVGKWRPTDGNDLRNNSTGGCDSAQVQGVAIPLQVAAVPRIIWDHQRRGGSAQGRRGSVHGQLVEVDLWDGRDHFAKLQLVLPCWTSGIGWLQLFLMPCLGSKSFGSLCLPLLFLLVAFHFSVLFIVAPDLRCPSRSSYPCCFTSFFSPLAPWLWFLL